MDKKQNNPVIVIIAIILIIVALSWFLNLGKDNKKANEPTKIELMSYAQTVLNDNLTNTNYSRDKSQYEFIKTNLRYKIEGKVTVNNQENKFYMIIEFTNDSYKEYDLISLQVGNNIIYKK